MEEFVGIGGAGFLEETVVEGSAVTPAFMLPQSGAQGLASEIEASALVAKDVTPAARACGLPRPIAAKRQLPSAGDSDDAGRAGGGSGEGDEAVVRDEGKFAGHQFLQQIFFVRRTAAETRAERLKWNLRESSLFARHRHASENRASEFLAAIAGLDVIAGPAATVAHHAAGGVADHGGGGGLASVDAEEKVHFRQPDRFSRRG